MSRGCLLKHGVYRDSVTLLEVARELTRLAGVTDAAVVMGTEANKTLLQESGLLLPEVAAATANDLVIVVQAETEEAVDWALGMAEQRLARRPGAFQAGPDYQPRTIGAAVRAYPGANVAVISVPGPHAAAEAWEALHSGLHVLLFSDNVAVEDEVALKEYAARRGLLMMGAGCGSAILDGVALGFANVVPRGPVGIVSAAGTGLQEVSTLLARMGVGISQAIGTGGRDMSEAVGGITMLQGIRLLQADPQTGVLVLVSKSPAPAVARRVLEELGVGDKPVVVCFLGGDLESIAAAGAIPAPTLQEAAFLAAEAGGYVGSSADEVIERELVDLRGRAVELKRRLRAGQRFLRGLFSGGSLLTEALVLWRGLLGDVFSNVPLEPRLRLSDPTCSQGHCAVDLGAEEFTVGRPHPMIDLDLRVRRLLQEAADPEVAVVQLDVVLGYGAHPDPAGELRPAIAQARDRVAQRGHDLVVVASVTGTDGDPQCSGRQVQVLREAGVEVVSSNAAAARLAGLVVQAWC